jgi:DnaJ family protein C protein 1
MWTDDDLAKLTKLVKKYPGGTPDRWETIAAILERLPWEVTKMAQKIKNNSYMVIR